MGKPLVKRRQALTHTRRSSLQCLPTASHCKAEIPRCGGSSALRLSPSLPSPQGGRPLPESSYESVADPSTSRMRNHPLPTPPVTSADVWEESISRRPSRLVADYYTRALSGERRHRPPAAFRCAFCGHGRPRGARETDDSLLLANRRLSIGPLKSRRPCCWIGCKPIIAVGGSLPCDALLQMARTFGCQLTRSGVCAGHRHCT